MLADKKSFKPFPMCALCKYGGSDYGVCKLHKTDYYGWYICADFKPYQHTRKVDR